MNNGLQQKVLSYSGIDTRSISKHPGYAVMIIDMQKMCLKGVHPSDERRILRSQATVIDYCIESNIPIFKVHYTGCGQTNFDIQEKLKEVPFIGKYTKRRDDAFKTYSRLPNILRNNGIDSLFMMGVYASMCLQESAISAKKKEFNVSTAWTVIADRFEFKRKGLDNDIKLIFENNNITFYETHNEFIDHLKLRDLSRRNP
jgi:isochorismate hydrolase